MRPLLLAAAVLLAAAAAGCAASPGEPPNSTPTGAPPEADFSASVTQEDDVLHIRYRLVNKSTTAVYVLNGVPLQEQTLTVRPAPDAVYVTGRGSHTVEIAKRAFDMPSTDRKAWEAPYRVAGRLVAPGEAFSEEVTVALPLHRRHPYGDDLGEGVIALPDPTDTVVFCVGVVREAWQPPESTAALPLFPHLSSTTTAQHLFCSAPAPVAQ
ncbi:hypothetical protein [Catellatospora sp. NPDC049609]|uniref:hypothetical protein n=1 Tax=Catellatospora sp. NPDC049609 TaxID=3155505 RepID=UPI003443250C